MFPEPNNINDCAGLRIALASPERIRSWSRGEVTKPETINTRSLKPERDGLFCARIFGPVNDWECLCGKYKRPKFQGVVCDKCGVEVTRMSVRRERMGHIALASPVSHIWFFKGFPSRIGTLLDIPPKDLERVLYFEAHAVTDPGDTPLRIREILAEEQYRGYKAEYGERFQAQMGAGAIKELLKQVDVAALAIELRQRMKLETSTLKRAKIAKRLKVTEAFTRSGTQPEWMVLDVIPVLPPELRPVVPLDGGRFATSDLNDLYRRVINSNNRLKKLLQLNAPEVIVRNEKRMLQERVDALFENGKRGRLLRGVSNRPLKSLSDFLKGKQGRFRQNLLGKRVDYSGRSVIVVGPDLKLHQCGLPRKMALELFKPFLFNRLEHQGHAATIRQAKEMIAQGVPEVWDALDEVIQDHPVLLNRARTLHRLGIQAFQPVLVEGKAIRLHPLVCKAFNADFDGDQMAVHVPLSAMAQIEARTLLMSSQNLLSPATGQPSMVPDQDIVLGVYYLTWKGRGLRGEGMVFGNIDQIVAAHAAGVVETHAVIQLRLTGAVVDADAWHQEDPKQRNEQDGFACPAHTVNRDLITTTVGRAIFNRAMPPGVPYLNGLLKQQGILALVRRTHDLDGPGATVRVLEALKEVGFEWATRSGLSAGLDDLPVAPMRHTELGAAREAVAAAKKQFQSGTIEAISCSNLIRKTWIQATRRIRRDALKGLEHRARLHPVFAMVDSGAREMSDQLGHILGIGGVVLRPSGGIVETPVTGNFKEGLSPMDYFLSSRGVRKGLSDTSQRTAEAGYLTRKMVYVAHGVIVNELDCGAVDGIQVGALLEEDGTVRVRLRDRIQGRVVLEAIKDPCSGQALVAAGTLLTEDLASRIEAAGIASVRIRSVLTCETRRGVCARCYGTELASGRLVSLGEAVGVIAAQSLGEPPTQMTLRGRHSGGHALLEVPPSSHRAPMAGQVGIEGLEGGTIAHGEGLTRVARRGGHILLADDAGQVRMRLPLPRGAALKVVPGERVEAGTVLAQWDPLQEPLLAETGGRVELVNFDPKLNGWIEPDPLSGYTRMRIRPLRPDQPPPLLVLNDPLRQRPVKTYRLEPGMVLDVHPGDTVAPGDVLARLPGEGARQADSTGAVPRLTGLLEARTPAQSAILARVSGKVFLRQATRKAWRLEIIGETGELHEPEIPFGARLLVQDGDFIQAGQRLTDGAINPRDILDILGEKAYQRSLLDEIQKIYGSQGLAVDDKHLEIIIRQMLRWVRVTEVGDAPLVFGARVDKHQFRRVNARVLAEGGIPAVGEPEVLGLTKAALISESFLSAASFQETVRVITEAAVEGRIDHLRGLKENVMIGRLIPAGTGSAHHRHLGIEEGVHPEAAATDQLGLEDFDDEYKRMAQHVEEFVGLSEVEDI